MCGVIGARFLRPDTKQIALIETIFKNIQIRGRHASGFSVSEEGKIRTIKDSVPVSELISKYDILQNYHDDDLVYAMVGHARYSTSDLKYNQPIADERLAIVHNGVITQSHPSNWVDEFDLKAMNSNDSSLIHECIKNDYEPISHFPEASMAVCELHDDKTLKYYRNSQRPLWKYEFENGVIVASTKDAFVRAGLEPSQVDCDTEHDIQNVPSFPKSFPEVYGDRF